MCCAVVTNCPAQTELVNGFAFSVEKIPYRKGTIQRPASRGKDAR